MADVDPDMRHIGTPGGPRQAMERKLARLAGRFHGIVDDAQLRSLGITRSSVRRRLQTGKLIRKYPGVYAVGHTNLTIKGLWLAAVRACGEGAVLSHWDAAVLHGLLRSGARRAIHVTSTGRKCDSQQGIQLHRVRSLDPRDCTIVENILVTTIHRTLLDLAETVSTRHLRYAFDQARRMGKFDQNALNSVVKRNPGRHGIKPLTAFTAAVAVGDAPPPDLRSDTEQRFIDICHEHSIPLPETNVVVEGETVDAYWPMERLVVELDSWGFHGDRESFEEDRRRDEQLLLAGIQTLRFTRDRVLADPAGVGRSVSQMLASLHVASQP